MRLIDADELIITILTNDLCGDNNVDKAILNAPTIDAIPVEWLDKWGRRNTWYYGNKDNVITMLLRDWRCKQRVKQANEMLEKWDKENETTGKN